MRVAILGSESFTPAAMEDMHAIGLLAAIWREQGHEIRFLSGCNEFWDADLAILHVDLSMVPDSYIDFAGRFPAVINSSITDIRKSVISRNLMDSGYQGKVIVKTDLNSAGYPELLSEKGIVTEDIKQKHYNALGWPADAPKPYHVFDSFDQVPASIKDLPGIIIEKFRPEIDGGFYRIRRVFLFGDQAISYRMGDKQPVVDFGLPEAFEWIDNAAEVLAKARSMGLDYGTVDYTIHGGEHVILDVNKTPGRGRPPTEEAERDYQRILAHVAKGLEGFVVAQ